MKQRKILIFMQADIFSTGLQIQLHEWGFTPVEIVKTYETALQSATHQVPSLLLMDVMLHTEKNLIYDELMKRLHQIPIIFMSKKPADISKVAAPKQGNYHHKSLSLPCTETDLKVTIEDILGINIPSA
jgi:DNA-binding response OmpR family regulator